MHTNQFFSFRISLWIHAALILTLLLISGRTIVTSPAIPVISFKRVDISAYLPDFSTGGGGGGDRSPDPASRGIPPNFAPVQLAPPEAVIRNLDPQLAVEPTLVGPQTLAKIDMRLLGDPSGVVGPPSNGPGHSGGIGEGDKGGVGPRTGPGAGPDGDGGGITGPIHRPGSGVTMPQIIYQVEPEYTDAARKARYQGTAIFEAVVGADGSVRGLRLVRALGMGLDERAMQAVRQWKFRPGMKDGKPVDVLAAIEVTFRLL